MKPAPRLGLLVGCLIAVSSVADAAPPNIWGVFGNPANKAKEVYDASANKHGNHPQFERRPPLKALADPANFESPNPAIALAAEVKKAEDEAPQKIKAIKQLAKVGCGGPDGCNENVGPALLAALDDCTEDVRLAAAEALTETAGDPCKRCSGSGCCSDEALTKLYNVAHGRDGTGCYYESSLKVRQAAAQALVACRRAAQPILPVEDDGFHETADHYLGPQPSMTTFAPPPSAKEVSPIVNPSKSFGPLRQAGVSRISGYMQGPPAPGHARF